MAVCPNYARKKRALPRHGIGKRTDACFESKLTAHESSRREKNKHLPLGSRDQKAPCNLPNSISTKVQLKLFVSTSSLEHVPTGIPLFQKKGNLYKATTQSINTNFNVDSLNCCIPFRVRFLTLRFQTVSLPSQLFYAYPTLEHPFFFCKGTFP
jgi:hypothetical protein